MEERQAFADLSALREAHHVLWHTPKHFSPNVPSHIISFRLVYHLNKLEK